ncbi:N-acetylglucosamine 6-phosphate deacetylase [Oryzihumus leptocrescens]|uniref:N-acetylglucosamine 6-phosphate deacetylase n=1 Tax=Oryzihumus leptocrescens TaxID=297536 RepID=A0A542ZM98_9MICO|nr:N-acetylglucosamine 6-phosphate deacetylase [Oryzihumus leptocrescens]
MLTDVFCTRQRFLVTYLPRARRTVHHARVTPAPSPARTLLTGRVVTPTAVLPDGAVALEGERIVFAGAARDLPPGWQGTPAADGWTPGATILPGLVDVHCHGGAGGEVGPDPAATRAAAAHHLRHGTTSLVGSLVSADPATLLAGTRTAATLVAAGELVGVHLEGPFLSDARRGAQRADALTDVDTDLVAVLARAAADAGAPQALAQMTFAPERDPGSRLPAALATHGILPAFGHTDADDTLVAAALRTARETAPRGGRPLVTHVFNGMPPLHHRSPGPVAACLSAAARGEAVLEVVGDGVHLAPGTVRMLFDLVGAEGLCLVTDAMAASGMPEGTYQLGGQEVRVEAGTARLVDGGAIAGGVTTLLDVVRWCVHEVGVPLLEAVTAASATPAEALALAGRGRLEAGARADLVVVDDQLASPRVMRCGAWL